MELWSSCVDYPVSFSTNYLIIGLIWLWPVSFVQLESTLSVHPKGGLSHNKTPPPR